jgi:amidophosphoribosyltransferase
MNESGHSTWLSDPFDDDKLREECGVYGVFGVDDAANYVALGLHALQHRGQEAAGIVSYSPDTGFNSVRRIGYVRDNFTKPNVMAMLPGRVSITLGDVKLSRT